MLYTLTINNVAFTDNTIELLAEKLVNNFKGIEQYLYYYDKEAFKEKIFFTKINGKYRYNFSRKEIDFLYDTICNLLNRD